MKKIIIYLVFVLVLFCLVSVNVAAIRNMYVGKVKEGEIIRNKGGIEPVEYVYTPVFVVVVSLSLEPNGRLISVLTEDDGEQTVSYYYDSPQGFFGKNMICGSYGS